MLSQWHPLFKTNQHCCVIERVLFIGELFIPHSSLPSSRRQESRELQFLPAVSPDSAVDRGRQLLVSPASYGGNTGQLHPCPARRAGQDHRPQGPHTENRRYYILHFARLDTHKSLKTSFLQINSFVKFLVGTCVAHDFSTLCLFSLSCSNLCFSPYLAPTFVSLPILLQPLFLSLSLSSFPLSLSQPFYCCWKHILCIYSPAPLDAHLARNAVEYIQFSFRWMNNLLMREFPLRCVIRLWDSYLVRREGNSLSKSYIKYIIIYNIYSV